MRDNKSILLSYIITNKNKAILIYKVVNQSITAQSRLHNDQSDDDDEEDWYFDASSKQRVNISFQ